MTDPKELIASLRAAPRLGADTDEPEGARFVQCSETLWLRLADALEAESARLDWIEENGCWMFQGPQDGQDRWFDADTLGSDYSPTIRSAIDAARRGKP